MAWQIIKAQLALLVVVSVLLCAWPFSLSSLSKVFLASEMSNEQLVEMLHARVCLHVYVHVFTCLSREKCLTQQQAQRTPWERPKSENLQSAAKSEWRIIS